MNKKAKAWGIPYHTKEIKNKPSKAAEMVGMAMRMPYFTKSRKENFTSYFLRSDENMMPAKAPIGVKKAPMLLPMTEAKIAYAKRMNNLWQQGNHVQRGQPAAVFVGPEFIRKK
jgi:hypothetical protein